jgi:hypothetical protein
MEPILGYTSPRDFASLQRIYEGNKWLLDQIGALFFLYFHENQVRAYSPYLG